jgi:fructokinase
MTGDAARESADSTNPPSRVPLTAEVLVIGEALVDIVARQDGRVEETPGGSPANVALTLARLGHSPHLLTALADDDHGRMVRAWLESSGVEVAAAPVARTSTATARLNSAGSATYAFDLQWSLADVAFASARVVHTGSIAALAQSSRTHLVRALERLRLDALVTYDPNVRPALLGHAADARGDVEELVALADIVKASDEDLRWLYPDAAPLDIARDWLERGPALVVVTTGAGGAFAVARSGACSVPARLVEVVDTVGAGDTFMGALVDGLLRLGYGDASARGELRDIGRSAVETILRFSVLAASLTVSRPGADPPRRAELVERFAQTVP